MSILYSGYGGNIQPSSFNNFAKTKSKYKKLESTVCKVWILFINDACSAPQSSIITGLNTGAIDIVTNAAATANAPAENDPLKYHCFDIIGSNIPFTPNDSTSDDSDKYEENTQGQFSLESSFIDFDNYNEFRKFKGSQCVKMLFATKGCCLGFGDIALNGEVMPIIADLVIGWDGLPDKGVKKIPFTIKWTNDCRPALYDNPYCTDPCYTN